jgi:hypothetical protein
LNPAGRTETYTVVQTNKESGWKSAFEKSNRNFVQNCCTIAGRSETLLLKGKN